MNELILFVEVQSIINRDFRYMSPEMIQKLGHDRGVDFYGMGALLYEMVYGFPPFYQ
jgi:serine/threonine protein kinase